jgi:diguanylate cyclase (GGDEF)-like protein
MGRLLAVIIPCLAWATLWATPARARAGAVGDPAPVCIARADPDSSPSALLVNSAHFDCSKDQRSFGPGDFDVLAPSLKPGAGQTWPAHVRFGSVWQQNATLFALYDDGKIARVPLDEHALTRSLSLGAIVDVRLPYRRIAVTRLLWRIQGSANVRGIVLGPHTATATQGWQSDLLLGALYAGFAGLCIALLVFNLALWCALRRPFQLAYCGMVLALLLYAVTSSGAVAWWWPSISNNDRIRFNYLALGLSAAAALEFARTFFEAGVFEGRTGRLARVVSIALIASAATFAVLAPWQARLLDRVYALTFVALLATVVPVLIKAWRLRSSYLWLFALAWGAPIAFSGLRVAASMGLIEWSFWIDNSTVMAMLAESMLSSVAIAYRIHLLSRERDEAREQEIAARLLADTDPLTGLLNRRAFLADAIGRAGDQKLIVVDIDHFKKVNDAIGHDGGDEVLRIVARVLRTAAAGNGVLVARLGGEEFAILSPAEQALDPRDLLDALREASMPFDLTVTASLGSCTGPMTRETDWKKLYSLADRALFAAKTAGRDRARDAGVLAAAA